MKFKNQDTTDLLQRTDLWLLQKMCFCVVNVIGLYLNIPHGEGLSFLKKHLHLWMEKEMSPDSTVELVEIFLENNIFNYSLKTYRQKRHSNAIGTKFDPPDSILFLFDLEERILQNFDLGPSVWWHILYFFKWQHGEETPNEFIESLNEFHPTINFKAEYSISLYNF